MTGAIEKEQRGRHSDIGGQTTDSPTQSDERFSKLNTDILALRHEVAREEGRVNELSSREINQIGPIIAGSGAAASSLIAVAGFFVVHYLSVRRQRRDEFFKRMQDCLTILERIGRDAFKVWRLPGQDKEGQTALESLQTDIDALSYRLARMQKLQPEFELNKALVELKREATLDVENLDRAADTARADRVRRLAQNLTHAILEQFDQVYG